jgi:hypothetical protein
MANQIYKRIDVHRFLDTMDLLVIHRSVVVVFVRPADDAESMALCEDQRRRQSRGNNPANIEASSLSIIG